MCHRPKESKAYAPAACCDALSRYGKRRCLKTGQSAREAMREPVHLKRIRDDWTISRVTKRCFPDPSRIRCLKFSSVFRTLPTGHFSLKTIHPHLQFLQPGLLRLEFPLLLLQRLDQQRNHFAICDRVAPIMVLTDRLGQNFLQFLSDKAYLSPSIETDFRKFIRPPIITHAAQ